MTDYPEKTFKSFTPIGMANDGGVHILERVAAGGKIHYYHDDRRLTQRIQVDVPKGTINIYKSFEPAHNFWRYKKMDILSLDGEILSTIDIFTDSGIIMNPSHKFMYLRSLIGGGKGDIEMAIAQRFLEDASMDPRYLAESSMDKEVLDMIQKVLEHKTI